MLFNTFEYLLFFVITIAVYFIIPFKFRNIWLLLTSYFFYGFWNVKYILLMFVITVISYVAGLMLAGGYKHACYTGIGACLALLIIFKYSNFLITNINSLLRMFGSNKVGNIPGIDLILPVGISFYTFQAISYIVDVYRNSKNAEKNFIRYSLYIAFFPQLVAGPIERGDRILSQLKKVECGEIRFDYDRFTNGLQWILYGLFMKMVIADRVSIMVNYVYSNYSHLTSIPLIIGALGFSIQIYCDFAGYSYIACGSAMVIGIELIENFKAPYFAKSVSEFWRRWHISLSTWFRDYVYIPLGGNRCSTARNYLNIMITMLLSGLWHGAAWHYVAWGGVHGIAQIAERIYRKSPFMTRIKKDGRFFSRFVKVILTTIFVSTAWVFFRANSLMEAIVYIKRMLIDFDITFLFTGDAFSLGLNIIECGILITAIVIMIAVDCFNYSLQLKEYELVNRQGLICKWVFNIVIIVFVVVFGVYGGDGVDASFIYFQF